jgi:hypothetical protein
MSSGPGGFPHRFQPTALCYQKDEESEEASCPGLTARERRRDSQTCQTSVVQPPGILSAF